MLRISRSATSVLCAFLVLAGFFFLPLAVSAADRQIVSGPYSLSVRGGSENNSAAIGFDGRVDYLTRMVNLHLLGTFELLEPNRGLGAIDQQRYGAALALSHTFPALANVYAGTAFVNEMGENFGHAYLGGKIKITDFALLSAAYGFGFGNVKQISKASSRFGAEAVDWLEAGFVLANAQGFKTNIYYTLTDPTDLKISGVAGEISYPIYDDFTLGVKGNADLNPDTGYWRNWGLYGFLTLAMGNQKGSPIDVALEKNNPVRLPVVLNKNVQSGLIITPATANINSCYRPPSSPAPKISITQNSVTFTASGGTGGYTWTKNTSFGKLTSSSGDTTVFFDDSCGPTYQALVTVTDSSGATATATINVSGD